MNPNSTSQTDPTAALEKLLSTQAAGKSGRRKRWLIGGVVLVVLAAALLLLSGKEKKAATQYKTEAVTVDTLVVKVAATGNLQPTNQVDVGSELSGIIDKVFVDDNDTVTKGQELARLDPAKLKDAAVKSRANLEVAEAQVLQAQATVAEAQATLTRYREVARLSGGKVPSQSEIDNAEASLKRAEAENAIASAGVTQAKANLQSTETDLSKASIRSPINGVVLSREVEQGQTVAASYQAPVLFTLAEDLAKMELQVDVDEADVGQVQAGQHATFSVDAWPGRQYTAVITRVGYGSQETDGVISYPAVLEVNNDDLSLRPGMTGTAEITTVTHEDALLVPNAALRFSPPVSPAAPEKSSGGVVGALLPHRPHRSQPVRVKTHTNQGQVWVLRDGQPEPVDVETGASDGRMTEIVGGALEAGVAVITESVENPS